MTILLVVFAGAAVLLGFLLMRRLDSFFERTPFPDSPQGRLHQGVLVYGAPEVADAIRRRGVRCQQLATPDFPAESLYSALFALSGDDLQNLQLCSEARQRDCGVAILARCNSPGLRPLFQSVGIDRILGENEPIDTLLMELWGAKQ